MSIHFTLILLHSRSPPICQLDRKIYLLEMCWKCKSIESVQVGQLLTNFTILPVGITLKVCHNTAPRRTKQNS